MKTPLRPIYADKFREMIKRSVAMHKIVGFPSDHPKWLQFQPIGLKHQNLKDYDFEIPTKEEQLQQSKATLLFKGSQSQFHMWFTIEDATREELRFLCWSNQEAYEYFRALKYEILEELNYSDDKLKNQYKHKIK